MKDKQEVIDQLIKVSGALNFEFTRTNISVVRASMFAGEVYSLLWLLDEIIKHEVKKEEPLPSTSTKRDVS